MGREKRAWYPLLAHVLNYGVPISVAFYGRGEMMSKYVATRIVYVRVRVCVSQRSPGVRHALA